MNKLYNLLTTCLLLCSAWLLPMTAKADHSAGGELTYEWISDSTYRFYLKFYRDCSGIEAYDTIMMCYYNSCNTNDANHIVLAKMAAIPGGIANGQEINNACPNVVTRCAYGGSATNPPPVIPIGTLPGYREWWYTGTVKLPSYCDAWTFYVSVNARNGVTNIGSIQDNLYIDATINNLDAHHQASPYFIANPISAACINQPYAYDISAIDSSGDSLSYEFITPRTSPNYLAGTGIHAYQYYCFGSYIAVDLSYKSPYNLSNPFPTNGTFKYDSVKSIMTFTPNLISNNSFAIRANKWHNGKKLGSIMRDGQFYVVTCNSSLKDTVEIDNSFIVNGKPQVCAGNPINFCYKVVSTFDSSALLATDDHNTSLSNAAIIYTGLGTDSANACVTWTPTINDTGLHHLVFTTNDTTCTAPGVRLSTTRTIPIYVCYNPVGIANTAITNKSVHIYPNPANNTVHITASVSVQVSIRSIDGREVLHTTNTRDIDISNLANGLYIVQVADEHGTPLQVEKLIKNK